MLQTTNYQLNQWEADDRILRTDFNADNSKIDTALKAIETKCGIQTIWSHISTSNEEEVQISLASVDWTLWKCVHLVIDPVLIRRESTEGCSAEC